ncbi:E3 ubiquitin-protein ligase RFWD3-like [Coccinella septempunctata]|uniref:E3 ubiquitin-protein ligase RFWD3-like n=1 Tax=Coccinella septempunctata TaxID=41139 RepID=UPI001D06FCE0|nr:E3 ubiquitin-protein ligase RFWD3-like [Coccinella septempunctata]
MMAASIQLLGFNPDSDSDEGGHTLVRRNSHVVEVQQPIVLLNDIHLASEIIVGANQNDDDVISIVSSSSTNSSENTISREATPVPEEVEKEEAEENDKNDDDDTESNSRKRSRSQYENEDDGQICPICLDNWTNSGEHRICCLKCGHLFGHSCILRWMQSQTKKSCPTCKKKILKSDIRFLYTKKLIAVDNSELQEMKVKLDCVINERNNIQLELSKYICREHALNQEITFLKSQLRTLKNNPLLFSNSSRSDAISNNSVPKIKLYMDKSLEVCPAGACRVFDVNPALDLIMVNVKSPSNLFSGFGLRKICISQYRTLAFLPLHTSQIRDVSFQNVNVLSVSTDKMVKITDSLNNSTVCSFVQTLPLWSCCWDSLDNNVFYIGTQMGAIHKYDLRSLGHPVNILEVPGDMSPVVSVAHIPNDVDSLTPEGLVSCKLNSLWFFEKTSEDYKRYPLGIDGPFYAMRFDDVSKQILVSSRPNLRNPNSRHTLATLSKVEDKVTSNSVHTFENPGIQRHLSRSCFIKRDQDYIAVHEESSKLVTLWNINNGTKATSVTAHDPVLDLSAIVNTDYNLLVGLTDKKMLFYKFS